MMEFLADYGLFLAKTLTLVFSIIILLSAAISMSSKAKRENGTLVLANLNEKMDEIRHSIQAETLPKSEWKKWQKAQKQEAKKKKSAEKKQRLFVVRFEGDMRASALTNLREIISAIIEVSMPGDQVLVALESPGGFVHSYGLAASQLVRLRQHKLHLTVAIDKVAASGGYLMACVANKIIAAPFAIVGSIGVVAQLPNFNKLLTKNHIDFEQHTAGEYKRTLTIFGKNTEKGREKFQEELEETHALFKNFIAHHRPQVNIAEVATGEHWHASQALNYHLVDAIQTSDDFILSKLKNYDVFEISYEEKQGLAQKLTGNILLACEKFFFKVISKSHPSLLR